MIVTIALMGAVMGVFLVLAWTENRKYTKEQAKEQERLRAFMHHRPTYETGQLWPPWWIGQQHRERTGLYHRTQDYVVASPNWAREVNKFATPDPVNGIIGSVKGVPIITSSFLAGKQAVIFTNMPTFSEKEKEKMRKAIARAIEGMWLKGDE